MIRPIAIILLILSLSSFNYNNSETTYSLTVEVHNTRNSTGLVQFALYNKYGSIPDKQYEKYYKLLTAKISNGSSSVTFRDLPEGTYVVNILHDENENGAVDKGFVLPIEGLGFSNYQSIGPANRPKYSRASFTLNSDMTIEIKVIYM
jgi:uncharacterized protein (DUF2141 family)